jgi:putative peptidoglycan lipid II flippase
MSLAALFPVAQTDAFWVAFTLPNALRQLLAEGAVSSAVVPVLAEVKEKEGEAGARAFFAKIRGLSAVALAVVTVAGVVGAPWLVELFAGGLAARPAQLERTIDLTRVVFPYIVFMGTAALGMAALHTAGRFVVASFAPAMLNVALMLAAFLLPGPLRERGLDPVLALGIGALLGGLLQVVCQWPSLRAIGYAARPRLDLSDPWVRKVLARLAPMTLGMGIYYIDLVVCRRLLSGEGEGAQSYFSWAQRLCDFPQGIFVMALSTAALPSLARQAAEGNRAEVAATFAHGMRLSLFVGLPVTALFVALPEPLVAAMFQKGEFGASSVRETARSLVGQGVGIWTVAAVRQLVAVFFALKDTRTPVIVSGIDLLALIALAYGLTPWLGHSGVSLAISGSSFVQMLCLWVLLSRKLPSLHGREILGSALRTLAASAAAGVGAAWIGGQLVGSGGLVGLLGPALAGGAGFGLIFVIVATLVGSEELDELLSGMLRKLGRAKRRG